MDNGMPYTCLAYLANAVTLVFIVIFIMNIYIITTVVGDRMFLGMQVFDFS